MSFLKISIFVCGFCIVHVQTYKPQYQKQNKNGIQQYGYSPSLTLYQTDLYGNIDQQPVFTSKPTNKQTNSKLFEIVNEWKYLDFEYSTYENRKRAIENR